MKTNTNREKLIESLIDYALTFEAEDFFENIENTDDLDVSEYHKRLLRDWYKGNIELNSEIRYAFMFIAGEHIYATAMCLHYGWV
jgi:hypothetical protein